MTTTMRYADLPSGNFFRIAVRPDLGEFFKCQPWVSTTADLEKMIQFKPDVEVVVTNLSGEVWAHDPPPWGEGVNGVP